MKSCEKIPNSYPCSNRPAICDHCEEIYWTYNMEIHHLKAHNEMNFNSLITDNERALIKKLYSKHLITIKHFHTKVLIKM